MTDDPSDIELVKAWSDGDNRAGSILVRRHFDALHRFFANKASGYEEDLIQQTFTASIEAKDAFRGESSFRAYLFGLARFQLLTHYRKAYRRPELEELASSVRDLATSPSGAVARHEEAKLLDSALRQIPLDHQIVLELTYREDLSAPEVARVLDIPENTVYSRLRRAKEQLRAAVNVSPPNMKPKRPVSGAPE